MGAKLGLTLKNYPWISTRVRVELSTVNMGPE